MARRSGSINSAFSSNRGRGGKRGGSGPISAPVGGKTGAAVRFGPDNCTYMVGGASPLSMDLGVAVLGSALYKAVQLPLGHAPIPTTGDFFVGMFFRTSARGGNAVETLLGRQGLNTNALPGGTLTITNPNTVDVTAAINKRTLTACGNFALSSANGGSWNVWKSGVTITAITLDPDTEYLMLVGNRDLGTTDQGRLIVVRCSDGAVMSGGVVDAPATSTKANRPVTNNTMWDQIGAGGAGTQAIFNMFVVTNPVASDTITINGVVITFVASGATGNQINIGASAALTAAAINTFINANSNALSFTSTVSTTTVAMAAKGTAPGAAIGAKGNLLTANSSSSKIAYDKGMITLTALPVAGETFVVNGVTITFVASGATGNQINIQAASAASTAIIITATAVATFFNANFAALGITTGQSVGSFNRVYFRATTPGITCTTGASLTYNASPTLGSASVSGFGGSVSDYFAVKGNAGTFPTTTQAQAIAQGQVDIGSIVAYLDPGAANGVTCQYYNKLDPATAVAGVMPPTIGSGGATMVGNFVTGDAPIRKPSALTLDRLGPYYVFPLQQQATSGLAWFEGSAPAGTAVTCKLKYLSGGTSASVTVIADSTGRYKASIRSPWKAAFTRYVSVAADLFNYIDEQAPMDLGVVFHTFTQSEGNILWSAALDFSWTQVMGVGGIVNSVAGVAAPLGNPATGPWASMHGVFAGGNGGTAVNEGSFMAATPQLVSGAGTPGDGMTQAMAYVISKLGCSVMGVPAGHSGTSVEAFIFDRLACHPATPPTVTNAGGFTYTFTLALTQTELRRLYPAYPNIILAQPLINQVLPGSVTITLPDGSVITDVSGGSNTAGTFQVVSGPATITSSSITYGSSTLASNGACSITFGQAHAGPWTDMKWTTKQETQDGSYVPRSGTGLTGWTNKDAVSANFSKAFKYGCTTGIYFQWTNNLGEGGTTTAFADSMGAKIDIWRNYVKTFFNPGLEPGLSDNFPIIVTPKGRDSQNVAGTVGNLDVARQGAQLLWNGSGYAGSFTWAFPGSWTLDTLMNSASSPHEMDLDRGIFRMGRRFGTDLVACYKNDRTVNQGPSWGTPILTTSNTIIEIPAVFHGADTALAVNATDGNANALDEWYTGIGSTPLLVLNDALSIARIKSGGQSVELVRLSGTWTTTQLNNTRYLIGPPGTGADMPHSLLYGNGGGFGSTEPGNMADPKFS
jgi:hypothetical protein